MVPRGHELRERTDEAFEAVYRSDVDTANHIKRKQEGAGAVKDDPVGSWATAGGVGIAAAVIVAGGWVIVAGGSGPVAAEILVRADYALAA